MKPKASNERARGAKGGIRKWCRIYHTSRNSSRNQKESWSAVYWENQGGYWRNSREVEEASEAGTVT